MFFCFSPRSPRVFGISFLLNDFSPLSRSLEQASLFLSRKMHFWRSRGSILHKLSKILLSGKSTYGSRETERGQHLCKFIGTKESVCKRKEFNSQRTGLGHQHGRRFIVLGHQYGRRDVMWKHSIAAQDECFESRGCAYKPFTISMQRKVKSLAW